MSAQTTLASWVNRLGEQPLVGKALRRAANLFPEGSVVTVRTGALSGLRWRQQRHHLTGLWMESCDDFARRSRAPSVLTTDVEGGGLDVLRGGKRALGEGHLGRLFELHEGALGASCVQIRSPHGYRFERLDSSVPAAAEREPQLVARANR